MKHLLAHFIQLLFPYRCLACDGLLVDNEKLICTHCLGNLPNMWNEKTMEDLIGQRFWGIVPIEKAVALFHFRKQGPIQQLLHKVKYKNRRRALNQLGKYCALLWQKMPSRIPLDAIVPVPLHPKRLRERGYNQSSLLTQGIARILNVDYHNNWLQRVVHTSSQTYKKKQKRIKNVAKGFATPQRSAIKGKHVLLVDDLVTTGATLRACAQVLLKAGAETISIMALAVAT